MRGFVAENKQKIEAKVLRQDLVALLDKGGFALGIIFSVERSVGLMEKLAKQYLSGSDMTHGEIWRTNRCAGDQFAFMQGVLGYLKVLSPFSVR